MKIEDLTNDILLEHIHIFTAPSESNNLRKVEGHRQVETFDDDLTIKFEDLNNDVLPNTTPIPAASESNN